MIRGLKAIKDIFKDMDKILLFVMIILSVFGLFNIVTASSRESVVNLDQSVYYYFYRQLIVLLGGFIAFFIVINIDTKKYYLIIPILFIIAVALNAYVIINGAITRGASNWIKVLPFFNLQPSEISKPVIIAAVALYIEKYGKKFRRPKISHWNIIMPLFMIGLVIPALVFFQQDLGTSLILLSIFGVMYLLSPILKKEKWKLIGAVAGVVIFAGLCLYTFRGHILSENQLKRFDYQDPCSKFSKNGYQVCNAYVAINLGGLTGVGIGKSTQKYSYIPEPHTDMVFAIVAEEYGFAFGTVIILLFGVILYRILMLSSRANTIRGKYICLGIAVYIFSHIFINLGGLFGLIPLTGVPLPFISYGGSFTISLIASFGIIQRIHIETKRHKVKF